MKILNLYAGIGGSRKLWGNEHDITAIELDESIAKIYQDFFPNDTVIITDAHQYLLEHFKQYDFIWASPPCPSHSRIRICYAYGSGQNEAIYPDMTLYQEIIFLDNYFKGKYVVENVIPYYEPLIQPQKKLHRHLYWANFNIGNFNVKNDRKHYSIKSDSIIYGFDLKNYKVPNKIKVLRNMVDPELGLYILNCAMNIITQENVNQTKLF